MNKLSALITVTLLSLAFTVKAYNSTDYERAVTSFEQQDIEAAYIHIKNALQSEPDHLPAQILYGKLLNEKLMYEEAEAEMRRALSLGADKNLVVEVLGMSLLRQGKSEQLISLFDEQVLSGASLLTYQTMKASAYLSLGKDDIALELYQKLNQQHPLNLDVALGLASVYITGSGLSEAQNIIDKYQTLYPEDVRLLRYQGTIDYQKGDFESSIAQFEQALKIEPDNLLSLRGLVNNYIAEDRFEEAQEVVSQLIAIAPYDPQARLLNSIILKGLDKDTEATQILKTITDELSSIDQTFMLSQPQLMLIDAMASYNLESWEQALKKLNKYIKHNVGKADIRAVVLLADVYKRVGRYGEAMDVLERYQQQLLQNREYAVLLAGMYINYGRHLEASELLAKLRDLYRDDHTVLVLQAHLLSKRDKVFEAIKLLQSSNVKRDHHFQHTLAVLLLRARDYDGAYELAAELIEAFPEKVEYQLLYVNALIKTGQIPKATSAIKALYQQHRDLPNVKLEYAKLLFNQGNAIEARKLLREMVADDSENPSYKMLLAEVEYATGNMSIAVNLLHPLTIDSVFQKSALIKLANIYLEQENAKESLRVTGQLLRLDRLDDIALFLHTRGLLAQSKFEEAQVYANKLQVIWQDDWQNLLKLTKLQVQAKNDAGAIKALTRADEISVNNPKVLLEKAKLEIFIADIQAATVTLQRLANEQLAAPAMIEFLWGKLEQAQGNLAKAMDYYSNSLAADPDMVPAFMNMATVGKKAKFSDQFIARATEVVKQRQDNTLYRLAIAEHLMMYKQYDESEYHYNLLLTQPLPQVNKAFALNNLALINIEQKDFDTAKRFSMLAAELIPSHPAILDTAGWANALAGDLDKGLYYLRSSYSMNSSEPNVIYHLAYTLHKLNRTAEANEYLDKLQRFSGYDEEQSAKQLMTELAKG